MQGVRLRVRDVLQGLIPRDRTHENELFVSPRIMAKLFAAADPRKAHRKGIRPLSGAALSEYRKKRKRHPPTFSSNTFKMGGKLTILPWGIHLTFVNGRDYDRFGRKGSGGSAYPSMPPISFSTSDPEHVEHETDHSFFHALFPHDAQWTKQTQEADRQRVERTLPSFLTTRQRQALTSRVVDSLVDEGYWAMRNEAHSYLTDLASSGRLARGSLYSWRRYRAGVVRRMNRLLDGAEFQSCTDAEKESLRQWVTGHCNHVRQLIEKNGAALDASPIPTPILDKLVYFLPHTQLHRHLPRLNQAFLERKREYEQKAGGVRPVKFEYIGDLDPVKARESFRALETFLENY